jgi:hypothetical protein
LANTFSNSQIVSFKSLDRWKNTAGFARKFDSSYSKEFGKPGSKIGSTYYKRKPIYFSTVSGLQLNTQAITELTMPITLALNTQVSYQLDDNEVYLKADDMMDRYGNAAIDALSAYVDVQSAIFAALATPNWVGTLGTAPTTNDLWLSAGTILDNYNAPDRGDRSLVVTPATMQKAVTIDQTLFNNQNVVGEEFKRGERRDDVHGFNWLKSQNVPVFQTGAYGGSPVINGANQTGTSLVVAGASAASAYKQGDKFQIAGVNAVNMQGKQDMGVLKQFTITSAVTASGGGDVTLNISPGIVTTGPYQNVLNAPANGAAITMWAPGSTKGNLNVGFTSDAFALVFGKLAVPKGNIIEGASETDPDTGISIRYTMSWDFNTSSNIVRWDVLWSPNSLYQEHAVVVAA